MAMAPLDGSQVHVWIASLATTNEASAGLAACLAPDEAARADRYATPLLRRRFVTARGILRRLLAAYLATDAREIVFGYGTHGKPHLAGTKDLAFNVSHAGDMAIYAIAAGREVGIDIEASTRAVDVEGVARTAFSARECGTLNALPEEARRDAFFRIWTRKEAYLKIRGDGFTYPTRSFSVSHGADDNALFGDERDAHAQDRWCVRGIDAPPGFAAALAAEGRDWTVLRFDAAQLPR